MIPNIVGCLAVSDLPEHLALVHVDGRDPAVRRFDERQALHAERASILFGGSGARFGRCVGTRATGSAYTAGSDSLDVVHVGSFRIGRKQSESADGRSRIYVKNVRLRIE